MPAYNNYVRVTAAFCRGFLPQFRFYINTAQVMQHGKFTYN